MPPSLSSVRLKIKRAGHHFDCVSALAKTYRSSQYQIVRESHNNATQVVYRLRMPAVDPDIGPIIGDCVHNLRSALDHIVYQLVLANGGTPTRSHQFPICNSSAGFTTQVDKNRLRGVASTAAALIQGLQPYPGTVNEPLWTLGELDNIDKHRTLTTVGGVIRDVTILMSDPATKTPMGMGNFVNAFRRDGEIIFGPIDIGSGSSFENIDLEPQGPALIAFEESVANRSDICDELRQLVDFVEQAVVPRFDPFF